MTDHLGEEVGVGPHRKPWPQGDQYDPELLRDGDRRNVLDKYRYWRREAIVADLDLRRHPFHVAIENWQHDLNIGTVVRNANAFLAEAVHIVGERKWNRRGAMVTDRYQHLEHHSTVEEFVEAMAASIVPSIIPWIEDFHPDTSTLFTSSQLRSPNARNAALFMFKAGPPTTHATRFPTRS